MLIGRREESGRAAFFDNRIIDADAPRQTFLRRQQPTVQLLRRRKSNNSPLRKFGARSHLQCAPRMHGSCSAQRVCCVPEARCLLSLSSKWETPYAQDLVMGWVRIRTKFAIFRAVDLRLRGTRRSTHGVFLSDGAAVAAGDTYFFMHLFIFIGNFFVYLFIYFTSFLTFK